MKLRSIGWSIILLLSACAHRNWTDVSYEQFVSDVVRDKNQPAEANLYGATWAGYFNYLNDYSVEWDGMQRWDPKLYLLRDFRRWCIAHDGQYRGASARPLGYKPTPNDFSELVYELDRGRYFNERRLYGYDCEGPRTNASLIVEVQNLDALNKRDARIYTKVFFYDPSARTAFFEREAKVQQARLAREAETRKDEERRADEKRRYVAEVQKERTAELRSNPKVGMRTSEGLIVEVKPPLALIQYDGSFVPSTGPFKWVPISELRAP